MRKEVGAPARKQERPCGLLGQGQRLTCGETPSEFPKLLVDADVLVESGHGAGARHAAAVGEETAKLTLTALQQVLLHAVECVPEVVASVLAAARFQELDRHDRPRDLQVRVNRLANGPLFAVCVLVWGTTWYAIVWQLEAIAPAPGVSSATA